MVTLQRALHLPADGAFGPVTRTAVVRLQRDHVLAVTGVVTRPVWVVLGAPTGHPTGPLARWARTILRQGATGPAVVALQQALRVTVDGAFGPRTAAAVTAYQRAHHLPVTSVVSTDTWLALGA